LQIPGLKVLIAWQPLAGKSALALSALAYPNEQGISTSRDI